MASENNNFNPVPSSVPVLLNSRRNGNELPANGGFLIVYRDNAGGGLSPMGNNFELGTRKNSGRNGPIISTVYCPYSPILLPNVLSGRSPNVIIAFINLHALMGRVRARRVRYAKRPASGSRYNSAGLYLFTRVAARRT